MTKKEYNVLSDVSEIDENLNEIIKAHTEELPVAKTREDGKFMGAVDQINREVHDHVQDLSLITPDDLARLKKSQNFLLQTYTDVRQYRPMINKLTTVLNNAQFPTIDSKFWQCKSEAEVHFNELQRETYKWQRARIDLDELDYKIDCIQKMLKGELTPVDQQKYDPNLIKFDIQRLLVKRSQYEFEIKQLEKSIKYRIEEVTDWSVIAESLEEQCQYNTRNSDEHLAETKAKWLEYQIKEEPDPEKKEMFAIQLRTLRDLVKSKAEQIKKES